MENTLLKEPSVQFANNVKHYYPEILTDAALAFITALHENFNAKRLALLTNREKQQKIFDSGQFPQFPIETKTILERVNWTAGEIPEDLTRQACRNYRAC